MIEICHNHVVQSYYHTIQSLHQLLNQIIPSSSAIPGWLSVGRKQRIPVEGQTDPSGITQSGGGCKGAGR